MRILVIGGTGFIGPLLVRRLCDLGHEVTIFHRGEREPKDLPTGVRHIHGDRAQIADFTADFAALQLDAVLDMRAMAEPDAIATLAAVRSATPRIIAVSSVDVYRAYGRLHGSEPGPIEPMPLTEDAPLRERLYPYRGERADASLDDYDKIPVERAYLGDAEVAGTIVRLPAVHGAGDDQHRMFMEVARIDAGRPFMLLQEDAAAWRWPRGYVANMADAIALAVTDPRAAGRVYHVAEPEPLTQRAWLQAVARVTGWRGDIITLPAASMPPALVARMNLAQDLVVDSSRIRAELGYTERVPLDDGIAQAIAWERAHPPAHINPTLIDFAAEDTAAARA